MFTYTHACTHAHVQYNITHIHIYAYTHTHTPMIQWCKDTGTRLCTDIHRNFVWFSETYAEHETVRGSLLHPCCECWAVRSGLTAQLLLYSTGLILTFLGCLVHINICVPEPKLKQQGRIQPSKRHQSQSECMQIALNLKAKRQRFEKVGDIVRQGKPYGKEAIWCF